MKESFLKKHFNFSGTKVIETKEIDIKKLQNLKNLPPDNETLFDICFSLAIALEATNEEIKALKKEKK